VTIAYNTGAAAATQSSGTGVFTLTIPAGVLPGDVLLIAATGGHNRLPPSDMTVTSSGTPLTQLGVTQRQDAFYTFEYGLFWAVADAADPGAMITVTWTADTTGFAIAVAAYTGAAGVDGYGSTGNFAATITAPSVVTTVPGDWAVQMAATYASSTLTPPTGTPRTAASDGTPGSGVAVAVVDTAAPVGPAGTVIGGGVFTPGNSYINFASTAGVNPQISPGTPVVPGQRFTRGISMWS